MNLLDQVLFKFLKIERSYSQSGEDKILRHFFNQCGFSAITYLDIGANHPIMSNNTYSFYRNGSRGVCIEPNPLLASLIRKTRPRDLCLNIGLGAGDVDEADLYLMSPHTLSTFSMESAYELARQDEYSIEQILKIPLSNINDVIKEHFDRPPDLVSLDVEDWNEEIVRSFDFSTSRPLCFCIETLTFEKSGGEKIRGIFEVFGDNKYEQYADTHINTIFVDRYAAK